MNLQKPRTRKRRIALLQQLDYFESLSKEQQRVGLLSFMETLGEDIDCPEGHERVPDDLDDEPDFNTSMFS